LKAGAFQTSDTSINAMDADVEEDDGDPSKIVFH
jgi:hypothetical protein